MVLAFDFNVVQHQELLINHYMELLFLFPFFEGSAEFSMAVHKMKHLSSTRNHTKTLSKLHYKRGFSSLEQSNQFLSPCRRIIVAHQNQITKNIPQKNHLFMEFTEQDHFPRQWHFSETPPSFSFYLKIYAHFSFTQNN